MTALRIVLKCTRCGTYRDFETAGTAVRCVTCGKRHSRESLHAVAPDEIDG